MAVEYIKKFSLKQQHGIKYILKNNGGVLSVIDKNLQTFYLQQFKKEKNVETLDNNDYMYICSELASNINVNIEMSILIIMLKKSNELIIFIINCIQQNDYIKLEESIIKIYYL